MKDNLNNNELTHSAVTPVGDSKAIVTNQPGIHEKLHEIVTKHCKHPSQKPYQAHTQNAFDEMDKLVQAHQGEVILDSCCGVGQSTRLLAQKNPQALVIGVDKSANRLDRNVEGEWLDNEGEALTNYQLVRADLNDFYRLVAKSNWPISRHYILYPNPWPKSKHVKRRWHGSAVFPDIMKIGKQLTLRSNWRLYLEEFQAAAKIVGVQGHITQVASGEQPLTPFEGKYQASGQVCWELLFDKIAR